MFRNRFTTVVYRARYVENDTIGTCTRKQPITRYYSHGMCLYLWLYFQTVFSQWYSFRTRLHKFRKAYRAIPRTLLERRFSLSLIFNSTTSSCTTPLANFPRVSVPVYVSRRLSARPWRSFHFCQVFCTRVRDLLVWVVWERTMYNLHRD